MRCYITVDTRFEITGFHNQSPSITIILVKAVLFTPIVLHCSISPGSESALKTMLEHNLDVHAKDKLGGTALHSAAYSGHVNCVKLLIQFGACVDALDMLQHTPIFRACEMGHTEVVNNLILRKFSFDRKISCAFIYYCALSLKEINDCLAVFVLHSETLYVFIYSGPLIAPFSQFWNARAFSET